MTRSLQSVFSITAADSSEKLSAAQAFIMTPVFLYSARSGLSLSSRGCSEFTSIKLWSKVTRESARRASIFISSSSGEIFATVIFRVFSPRYSPATKRRCGLIAKTASSAAITARTEIISPAEILFLSFFFNPAPLLRVRLNIGNKLRHRILRAGKAH